MSNYANAGKGLRIMYVSGIGIITCTILMVIPVIGFLFSIGILICMVMDFVGYYYAAKDIIGCRVAFIFRVVAGVLSVYGNYLEHSGKSNTLLSLVDSTLSLLAVCLIFTSVSKVLRENGKNELAKKGIVAMIIYLVCMPVCYFGEILAVVMLLRIRIIGMLLVMLTLLVLSIVALVHQLKFYKHSAQEFGVYF